MVTQKRRWLSRQGLVAAVAAALVALAASAQATLRCEASLDRTTIPAGGHVVLRITGSGDFLRGPELPAPQVAGAVVSAGGTSQSYSFVNGRSEASVTATYYLQFRRPGKYTIEPLTITAGSDRCRTEALEVTVTAAADQVPPDQTGNRVAAPTTPPPAAAPATAGPAAGRPGDESFITVAVDRREAWVGQQVTLSFKYHRRVNPWDNPNYEAPSTEGFWRVDLPPERNYRQQIEGFLYQVTEIRYALFATRAGQLEIGPARLAFAEDPFARLRGRSRGRRTLTTEPVTVRVKELPLPRPADFSGIVAGDLTVAATVDRDTVPRGEAVQLDLRLTADGFLKSFGGIELDLPADVRVHDAANDLREDVSGPRYTATMRQEKVLVPTREGELDLPPVRVTYFDADSGRYASADADPGQITVVGSDLPATGDDISGFRRAEIERVGSDLAFLHATDGPLRRLRPALPEQARWWGALLAPLALLAGWRVILIRRADELGDPAARRRRGAGRRARRLLDRVARVGDDQEALALVAAAVRGYVADRSGRAAASITPAQIELLAVELGEGTAAASLATVLGACDSARFGGGSTADPRALAATATTAIAQLERSGGGRRGSGAGALAALASWLVLVGAAAGWAQTSAPGPIGQPEQLVAEANQAYTAGDIDAARSGYERALDQGVDDPNVHYNLANAHARQGALGRAIVGYLRAQRLAPRDRDIRANLAWVRAQTRDLELAGAGLPPVVAQLDQGVGRLSLGEWSVLLVSFVWLGAALVGLVWWRGFLGDGLRRALLVVAVCGGVTALVTGLRWYHERVRDVAVVIAEEVEVRSGPTTSFPVVFRIHDGLTLTVRGERDGWARIGLGGDWVGWIPESALVRVRRES